MATIGHAVEQRFAEAGERVGDAGAGHDAEDAGPAGAAGVAVGHAGGGELVRDEQVRQAAGLQRRPRVRFPGARDAEDAADALLLQGGDGGLGPGEPAGDPAVLAFRAE